MYRICSGFYRKGLGVTDGTYINHAMPYMDESKTVVITLGLWEYTIHLYPGWNVISIPLIHDYFYASTLDADLEPGDIIWQREIYGTVNLQHVVDDPTSPDFRMKCGYGYYIWSGSDKDLIVRGTPKALGEKIVIPLKQGWNIMGWVNFTVLNDPYNDRYLYSKCCSPRGYIITAWDEVNQKYHDEPYIRNFIDDDPDNYMPPDPPGWPWNIEPGRGYWVSVGAEGTMTY